MDVAEAPLNKKREKIDVNIIASSNENCNQTF